MRDPDLRQRNPMPRESAFAIAVWLILSIVIALLAALSQWAQLWWLALGCTFAAGALLLRSGRS